MANLTLDKDAFYRRMNRLYSSFKVSFFNGPWLNWLISRLQNLKFEYFFKVLNKFSLCNNMKK